MFWTRPKRTLNFGNFIDAVLQATPSFSEDYDEHLADYRTGSEHLWMGDLTRHVIKLYREMRLSRGRRTEKAELKAVLEVLEEGMKSQDLRLEEMISVSFLENLHQAEEAYEGIRRMLGRALRRELTHYE